MSIDENSNDMALVARALMNEMRNATRWSDVMIAFDALVTTRLMWNSMREKDVKEGACDKYTEAAE